MAIYSVRYVHKVATSSHNPGGEVDISDNAFSNRNTLAKALRDNSVLVPGTRVREFRVEGDRVVVFPTLPGLSTYWHSVILTAKGD